MTDRDTSIAATSPSGDGRYTLTDKGFEIRFSGLGFSTRRETALFVYFGFLVVAGPWIFSVVPDPDMASIIRLDPTPQCVMWSTAVLLSVIGFTGILVMFVKQSFAVHYAKGGAYLYIGSDLVSREWAWRIPVNNIHKMVVHLNGPPKRSAKQDRVPSTANAEGSVWFTLGSALNIHTDLGVIELLIHKNLKDQQWVAAILNEHVTLQDEILLAEKARLKQAERDRAATAKPTRKKRIMMVLNLAGILVCAMMPWYMVWSTRFFSNANLSHYSDQRRAELIEASIYWLQNGIALLGMTFVLITPLMVLVFIKAVKTGKPRRGVNQYQFRLDSQTLENT